MSDFSLRRAVPADAGLVRALTRAAYAKWVAIVGREPRPMTADYERALTEHLIDIFERNGDAIALIEMKAETDHLMIVNIAVAPDQHGHGIGTRLLQHAEDVARALGLGEMRLYTNERMTANIALYARRGYREERREPAGTLGTVVHMKKSLKAAAS